jgi:flavin reductase (DIM6/NTAB) family NADH-FMN oxidoreductase RutF
VFAGPVADRFAEVSWSPFGRYRLPYLSEDAFALAACRVAGTMVAGDHTVVFGEVAEVTHVADVPLLYGMRQFSSWSAPSKPLHGAGPTHAGSGPALFCSARLEE